MMANNDSRLQGYQDELDDDARKKDEVTEELTDDPTKLFHVPPKELRDELDKDEQIMKEHGDVDSDETGNDEDET